MPTIRVHHDDVVHPLCVDALESELLAVGRPGRVVVIGVAVVDGAFVRSIGVHHPDGRTGVSCDVRDLATVRGERGVATDAELSSLMPVRPHGGYEGVRGRVPGEGDSAVVPWERRVYGGCRGDGEGQPSDEQGTDAHRDWQRVAAHQVAWAAL